jgi:hypothetical protein
VVAPYDRPPALDPRELARAGIVVVAGVLVLLALAVAFADGGL